MKTLKKKIINLKFSKKMCMDRGKMFQKQLKNLKNKNQIRKELVIK